MKTSYGTVIKERDHCHIDIQSGCVNSILYCPKIMWSRYHSSIITCPVVIGSIIEPIMNKRNVVPSRTIAEESSIPYCRSSALKTTFKGKVAAWTDTTSWGQ
jgi:hypothetical protein